MLAQFVIICAMVFGGIMDVVEPRQDKFLFLNWAENTFSFCKYTASCLAVNLTASDHTYQ